MEYEIVVGIETHVELDTKTKIFCACEIDADAPPNTRVCPVCMGLPGALPALNGAAVALAARAGLALGCDIARASGFDRKHYFYPDLPKGYQITQYETPLCTGGGVTLSSGKFVPITRIHLEEDAGKLLHEGDLSLVDFNRCGVPLIEIVSAPALNGAEEAAEYVRALRDQLIYAGVTKGRMNEGHLRADVNLSVRRKGETRLNERAEIKNLNSFQSIKRAVECEAARQIAVMESGGRVACETLRFDQTTGAITVMRRKETAADYRYMPEANLPPARMTDADLARVRAGMPRLLNERRDKYLSLGLTPYAAGQMLMKKETADAFERALTFCAAPVALANLFLSCEGDLDCAPQALAALADLTASGRVSSGAGRKILEILRCTGEQPLDIARREGLLLMEDDGALREAALAALEEHPDLVEKYRSGKTNAFRALMGAAMARTRGRGDPKKLTVMLAELIDQKNAEGIDG